MQRSRSQLPPQRPQMQISPEAKTVKTKKAMSRGGVIATSLIVSFILLLIFSIGLIFVATARSASDQAMYAQMLSDAENQVKEASLNVAFSPAQSIRDKALAPAVNFEIARDEAVEGADPANPDVPQTQRVTSFGSGIVISKQGDTFYILTNNHVISGALEIKAVIGEAEYKGEIAGTDQSSDLAIVSIQAKDLPVAQLGSSAAVSTGDYTMSVGNPYGLNDTMTSGIVSATGRNMTYGEGEATILYANMIQTDAPVNPGNSGGGLYNANGDLIGINTLVGGDGSHSDSIGYAIPIDFAIPIAKNLIAGQPGAHATFGIAMSNVPDEIVAQYGLPSNAGAYVNNTTPSGPAEIAGIVPGDIIVSYDGKDIDSAQDMLYKIRASVINDTKDIKILREGKEMVLSIKVGSDV